MIECQFCGRRRATRPQQLCWNCYYTPGVRELYPATSKYARRGAGRGCRPAPSPTSALPGSLEKILVLSRRAALGQELWHPDDATVMGAPPLARAG